jgi:ERCC4-type nuclease
MDVSPTEPPALRALGQTTGQPEQHGCDVLWTGATGLVGVQRKTLTDLAVSLRDGRLAREVAAMRLLAVRVLLVEGRVRWSPTGMLTTARPSLSKDQLRGLLWSAQHRGLWVVHTDDLEDSVAAIAHLHGWLDKPRHTALEIRRSATPPTRSREWAVHLLQSFPLVGPVSAANIHDHFGGAPLSWSGSLDDLAAVKGVGPIRAQGLWSALA